MKTKNSISVKREQRLKRMLMVITLLAIYSMPVFAADPGEAEFYKVILFIAGWLAKLGMVVGFFGAVQTAFGFKNDDADAKVKGLRTMISGFIVFAIASPATLSSLFGIK